MCSFGVAKIVPFGLSKVSSGVLFTPDVYCLLQADFGHAGLGFLGGFLCLLSLSGILFAYSLRQRIPSYLSEDQ